MERKRFSIRGSGWLTFAFVLWLLVAGTPAVMLMFIPLVIQGELNGYITYLALAISELMLIVPLVVYMAARRIPLKALVGNRTTGAQNLLAIPLGALMSGAMLGLNQLMMQLAHRIGLPMQDSSFLEPTSWGLMLVSIVAVGVTAGIVEEPIFRGVVLRSFATSGSRWRAILVSSIVFSLIHMDLVGAPSRFLIGVLLALMTWQCGGILPSVIAHAAYNGMALLIGFLATQYFPDYTSFAFLQALPTEGAELLTMVLLSLPFLLALVPCYWLFCRISPASWSDKPNSQFKEKGAALPWWLVGIVIAASTATNIMLLRFLARLPEMLPPGFS